MGGAACCPYPEPVTPRELYPVITQSSCRPNSTPEKRLISPLQNTNPASPLAHTRLRVHSLMRGHAGRLSRLLSARRPFLHPPGAVGTNPRVTTATWGQGSQKPCDCRHCPSRAYGPPGQERVAQTESDFCVLPGRGTAAGLSCAETTWQTPMWSWESQAGG